MKRMVMVVMFLLCVLATSQYVNAGSWFFNFNDSSHGVFWAKRVQSTLD
jgi:hypothetical protein